MADWRIIVFWLFIVLVVPTLAAICGFLCGRMDISVENEEKIIIREEKIYITQLEECANELSAVISEFDMMEMNRKLINNIYKLINKWRKDAKIGK